MECKMVCDGKEVGTITHNQDGMTIKMNEEGKAMCKSHKCCEE